MIDFGNFTVQDFTFFRDAADCSKLDFENHVTASILNDAVSYVLQLLTVAILVN